MPCGTYLSSSFLYFNLGCHMMFILKNRLQAQGITSEKSAKIIHQLTSAIFKQHFVKTLLTPQEPLAISAFKDLFRKLAHSSIMKLDEASMEKLLYLILMTVKKELFLTSSPLELYPLTLGNLRTLQEYTKLTPSEALLEVDINLFIQTAEKLTFMEYKEVREYLLTLLENYQTKVINFFESGHQNSQGKLTFQRRNTHNLIPVGQTRNHPKLQLGAAAAKSTQLPLSKWRDWKTSLVVDHVTQYDRQSEQRKINNQMGWVGKEKSLNDFFGIGGQEVSDFEVKLDLFDYEQTKKAAPVPKGAKVVESSGQQKQESASIAKKIDKQFEDLKGAAEEEVDLLDLMDS